MLSSTLVGLTVIIETLTTMMILFISLYYWISLFYWFYVISFQLFCSSPNSFFT